MDIDGQTSGMLQGSGFLLQFLGQWGGNSFLFPS